MKHSLIPLLLISAILASVAFAMPPIDGGPMPDFPPGVNEPDQYAPSRDDADVEGEWNLLVLMVDFDDYTWDNQDDDLFHNEGTPYTVEHFEAMLFSDNDFAYPGSESDYTGSMRDYYSEISGGDFTVTGVVTHWYRAPEDYSYYVGDNNGTGAYPNNSQGLVEDIVEIANGDIDFSNFDNDGDGVVDALAIVHAGPGSEEVPAEFRENYIWSHKWSIWNDLFVDDVRISGYNIDPQTGTIGVFCHEFGHTLGLPDLYDIDYSSEGVGEWALMSAGGWASRAGDPAGTSPSHMIGWSKLQLGWVDVVNVEETMNDVVIPPIATDNVIYKMWTDGDDQSPEYFLLENRRQIGFDAGLTRRQVGNNLPAPEGILITHIDERQAGQGNQDNADETHRLVDVEEASLIWMDGIPIENMDFERDGSALDLHNANRGDNGDVWPGFAETNEDATDWIGDRSRVYFGIGSTPNSHSYEGAPSLVEVNNIRLDGENVIADLSVNAPERPLLAPLEVTFDDNANGNGNGTIEPGETFSLSISLQNFGTVEAENPTGTISTQMPDVTINWAESEYDNIPPQENRINESAFLVEIGMDVPVNSDLAFLLTIELENAETAEYPVFLSMKPPNSWQKYAQNPVLAGERDSWDRDILSPAIVVDGDTLRCWYLGGNEDLEPPITGEIGYAWSVDGGVNWVRNGDPVLIHEGIDWAAAGLGGLGIYGNSRIGYTMMIVGLRSEEEDDVVIGQATSDDGFAWDVSADPAIVPNNQTFGAFMPSQLVVQPFPPFQMACMFTGFPGVNQYQFTSIGIALTMNGQDWSINPDIKIDPSWEPATFDAFSTMAPDAIATPEGDMLSIVYTGIGRDFGGRLGMLRTNGQMMERVPGEADFGAILVPGGGGSWNNEEFIFGGRQFIWHDEVRMLYTGVTNAQDRAAVGLASRSGIRAVPDDGFDVVHPVTIVLDPAYPNPFNSTTVFSYSLPLNSEVETSIYSITGRKVKTLFSGFQVAGTHQLSWNGENNDGKMVAAGTYLINVKLTNGNNYSKQVILLK